MLLHTTSREAATRRDAANRRTARVACNTMFFGSRIHSGASRRRDRSPSWPFRARRGRGHPKMFAASCEAGEPEISEKPAAAPLTATADFRSPFRPPVASESFRVSNSNSRWSGGRSSGVAFFAAGASTEKVAVTKSDCCGQACMLWARSRSTFSFAVEKASLPLRTTVVRSQKPWRPARARESDVSRRWRKAWMALAGVCVVAGAAVRIAAVRDDLWLDEVGSLAFALGALQLYEPLASSRDTTTTTITT